MKHPLFHLLPDNNSTSLLPISHVNLLFPINSSAKHWSLAGKLSNQETSRFIKKHCRSFVKFPLLIHNDQDSPLCNIAPNKSKFNGEESQLLQLILCTFANYSLFGTVALIFKKRKRKKRAILNKNELFSCSLYHNLDLWCWLVLKISLVSLLLQWTNMVLHPSRSKRNDVGLRWSVEEFNNQVPIWDFPGCLSWITSYRNCSDKISYNSW